MDDLTRIKGIGKSTAARLADAGFGTYAQLAEGGKPENLKKLQDAGFATVDIDRWTLAAADLITNIPPESDQGGAGDTAGPAGGSGGNEKASKRLVAVQEVRHLGVTYAPGEVLPATVDGNEAAFLISRGSAAEAD